MGRSELPIPMEADFPAEWKRASPQQTQDNNNKETNPINKTRENKSQEAVVVCRKKSAPPPREQGRGCLRRWS